jgi:xanthine dehydrogenase accessory factor
MRHILKELVAALERNEAVIFAGIIRSSGSAPRSSGARMLIRQDGHFFGSVGGGALEGACQEKAAEMLAQGKEYHELKFELTALSAADAGMICGGMVTVLLQRITQAQIGIFSRLLETFNQGRQSMLITILPQNDHLLQLLALTDDDDGSVPLLLRKELLRKPRRLSFLMEFEGQELFVEPLLRPVTVHLIGAGHVALATAVCASFSGFEVVVKDDRAEFANAERYPQAREVVVLDSFADCFGELGADDYVVIVTRGHLHDRDVLAQALRTGAGYIGMIGSSRKREGVYRSLLDGGYTEDDLQRVHCPIGLAIGADTPEEIAVSIVAEMIKKRAGLSG